MKETSDELQILQVGFSDALKSFLKVSRRSDIVFMVFQNMDLVLKFKNDALDGLPEGIES
ncbi:MAG: hypothetical protein EX263_13610 [Flavobacteriaceae bacterium]|nr:MAG: hypothetical protein EX263_13610 [Flavobacteriaceae bacterium]